LGTGGWGLGAGGLGQEIKGTLEAKC